MTFAKADAMIEVGIVQHPNKVLETACVDYELPDEANIARADFAKLQIVADKVFAQHQTKKGLGVAAPQIGIAGRISVFRPWNGDEICLLNPRIVSASAEKDLKYEGCLSLFDVRGMVERSLKITVQCQTFDGDVWTREFINAHARLIAHEIDHLDGHTYLDRLVGELISVDEYRRLQNTDWVY